MVTSKLLCPSLCDGPRNLQEGVAVDAPTMNPTATGPDTDDGADERTERPRRSAKSTRAAEYTYF